MAKTTLQSRHKVPVAAPWGGPLGVSGGLPTPATAKAESTWEDRGPGCPGEDLVREPCGGQGFSGLGWGWPTLTFPQHLCSLQCTSQRP